MIIKTKKYALDQKTYISLAMRSWVKHNWYWGFVPLGLIFINAILNITGVYPNWWIYLVIVLLTILYVLFWAVQFTGITQMEQTKALFQKYVYEIDSRQIMLKLNAREGGILKWDQIRSVTKDKTAYVMVVSNDQAMNGMKVNWLAKIVAKGMKDAQFLYLPYSIFTTENELKFMDTLLKRKGFLSEAEK
ncbi:YcxB family protein [Larkinella terrae]|uniref:YcxB family protein n=1 Tax=Larkinella terrae TaxID=2025311 RepID=A0A7K0EMU6_9BACT|nr:YcxB family protein [Larkinella terrae]MRS63119.1 YcxB family protein [Larkinella terrae]